MMEAGWMWVYPNNKGGPGDLLIYFTIVIMYEIFDRMEIRPRNFMEIYDIIDIRYGIRSLW